MKILVTGHAGFIGFHVSLKLLQLGHEVVGIDNMNDFYNPMLKHDRENILLNYPNFDFYYADICQNPSDESLIGDMFLNNKFDVVVHLAAYANVRDSVYNSKPYLESNINGFYNILELCKKYNIKKVVYASSSCVYGNDSTTPFTEPIKTSNPINWYAISKCTNEMMAYSYSSLYNMNIVGLRYFTVYGPWGRPDMAMWLFTDAIMKNKPIKLFNDGMLVRDFVYIDDVVNATVKTILHEYTLPFLINIGSDKSHILQDVVNVIEKSLNKNSKIENKPKNDEEMIVTKANMKLANEVLDFHPKIDIHEGIPKFIEWFKGVNY